MVFDMLQFKANDLAIVDREDASERDFGIGEITNMNLTLYSENNTRARNPKLQNDLSCISAFTICCHYRLHRMNCALIKSQSLTMHSNILNNKNMKMRYTCQ